MHVENNAANIIKKVESWECPQTLIGHGFNGSNG